jgi:arsenical pump membrane protein
MTLRPLSIAEDDTIPADGAAAATAVGEDGIPAGAAPATVAIREHPIPADAATASTTIGDQAIPAGAAAATTFGARARQGRRADHPRRRPPDHLRTAVWFGAAALTGIALLLRLPLLGSAALGTLGAFATLGGVIAAGLLADRLGLFRLLARALLPARAPDRLAVAGTLAFAALLSGLINLDVAVVVAVPCALEVAAERRLRPERLVAAVALTSNATSFLLPTSNLTTLLVLGRSPLAAATYVTHSWPAWLLVAAFTVGALTLVTPIGVASASTARQAGRAGGPVALLDLLPLFAAASAIRALLDGGAVLGGGLGRVLLGSSLLAALVNNLPAAAAIRPQGLTATWAAVLGLAIGPDLVITGSLATLISRRIARDHQAGFATGWYSLLGAALLPLQLAVAAGALHLTGAL